MISELLKIEDPLERSFYEQQAVREKWAVRELQRQKKTSLFLRLAAGKDKDAILQLASQGQIVSEPADLLRDPYVFEFLKIPEPHHVTETDLETRLCDHQGAGLTRIQGVWESRPHSSSHTALRTTALPISPSSFQRLTTFYSVQATRLRDFAKIRHSSLSAFSF